jgi:hypothetical protein
MLFDGVKKSIAHRVRSYQSRDQSSRGTSTLPLTPE